MVLNIKGIDQDPELAQPSRQNLLQAAEACSARAASKSQFLQKLDALRGIIPIKKTRLLNFLPFNLLDIIREDAERLMVDGNAHDHFWKSAGDVLIKIVNDHPSIGYSIQAVIAAGGDVEITAHNEVGKITLTVALPTRQRQILFDNRGQAITHQSAA